MKTFIVKPDGGMQGAGIFLVRSGQVFFSPSSLLLLSLEFSDTKVYEP